MLSMVESSRNLIYLLFMANTNPVRFSTAMTIRAEPSFFEMLDEIRRTRTPIPSRSDIIRELVEVEAARIKKGK